MWNTVLELELELDPELEPPEHGREGTGTVLDKKRTE